MSTPDIRNPASPWHALTADETLASLDARPDGLTETEARARLAQYGPNELLAAAPPSIALLALNQLRSPLIYMLFAAAVISGITGHPIDAGVIMAVVVLNTVVGVLQEWRAERALEALRRMAAPHATVIRDGEVIVIPSPEVVPGDILLLESGDRVAADARVLESTDLFVDESALTGESHPSGKEAGAQPATTAMADRTGMVWMSTAVTGGRGRAVAVATGMQTGMGEIAREVRATQREETPLQRRIASMGVWLGYLAVGLSIVIGLLGVLRGFPPIDMLLYAVAMAVAAIPEGLPAVISVVLALGVQRMASQHAILRRLPAVETLGSTTVICTDKTGTITRNEMTAARLWVWNTTFHVSGVGFAPQGTIWPEGQETMAAEQWPSRDALRWLLTTGCVASDAVLERDGQNWKVIGDPTEGALLAVAHKANLVPETLRRTHTRLDEIPFSSKHKYMATLNQLPGSMSPVLLVKGAPEKILAFSTHILIDGKHELLTEERRQQVQEIITHLSGETLRVLAGAYREMAPGTQEFEHADAERELTLIGCWGMFDPPRAEVIPAIAAAQRAGIRIVMITGDSPTTAAAIARDVGILAEGDETVTGEELDAMSDLELSDRMPRLAVFARVTPLHKLRIVNALSARGEITAMTGDGVNDAPALKRANIGIAMGISGTEVAKEAADMVLTDDNFATIVRAVEEGRVIYGNLRKVVFFLATTNGGEILTIAAALLIGIPLPLTAVMILWVNLVTDGLCTAPLGVEPGHGDVLDRPPRSQKEGIIDRHTLRRMLTLAPLMAAGTLGLFWFEFGQNGLAYARTVAFTTLVAFQWFHALNARSQHSSLFAIGLFSNRWLFAGIFAAVTLQVLVVSLPALNVLFRTVPISLADWGLIVLVSSSIFFIDELMKFVVRRTLSGTKFRPE